MHTGLPATSPPGCRVISPTSNYPTHAFTSFKSLRSIVPEVENLPWLIPRAGSLCGSQASTEAFAGRLKKPKLGSFEEASTVAVRRTMSPLLTSIALGTVPYKR